VRDTSLSTLGSEKVNETFSIYASAYHSITKCSATHIDQQVEFTITLLSDDLVGRPYQPRLALERIDLL
jgi:hypothetical protein